MSSSVPPRVTLKLATSLDGKIALSNGQSKWITGPESRAEVHRMRAAHDAILTGVGTILADDPEFTARTDPMPDKQPDLIILDREGRMNMGAKVFARGDRQVILRASGDIGAAIAGYATVMIEAGGRIAAAAGCQDGATFCMCVLAGSVVVLGAGSAHHLLKWPFRSPEKSNKKERFD